MVAYDRGMFVAVEWKDVILTSADGARWTARSSGSSERLDGIACRDGHFVANITNRTALVADGSVKRAKPQSGA